MFDCAVWGCTWVGWLTGKKESLTEEEEICVLSVAAVMDPGYPVAISSHVDQSHPLSLPLSNNLSRNIVCRAISDYNSTQSSSNPMRSSLFNIFLPFPLKTSLFNIFLSFPLRSSLFNIFLSFPPQLKLSCFPSGAHFLFPIFSRGCQLLQKSA